MGGIERSPSRLHIKCSQTSRDKLRPEMNPSGIAPQKQPGAPSIAFFAMGGIERSPSRLLIKSSLTSRDKLRPDMNPSGIAPQRNRAGCPIHRVFCDGWDTTKPNPPGSREDLKTTPKDRINMPPPNLAENLRSPAQNRHMHLLQPQPANSSESPLRIIRKTPGGGTPQQNGGQNRLSPHITQLK